MFNRVPLRGAWRVMTDVGAGCSIDSPSNLPAGKSMMKDIVTFFCPEQEHKKLIASLDKLRFETLIGIINKVDKELRLIDYYGQCGNPNSQHVFLADKIKNNCFVMTTNFDTLIEHALIKLDEPLEYIKPVITREDFEKYSNPAKLLEKGIKAVYKIHGSSKNLITKKDTRKSLITTLRALGSNKRFQ